jgi:hypothetical protein
VTSCAVLSWAARAGADPSPPTGTESRGFVEVSIKGPPGDASSLSEALRELLARLKLDLRLAPPGDAPVTSAPDDAERARVEVDETPADHVDIVVTEVRHGAPSPPVLRALAKNDSSAILTEQIAHVVHATLESLLATEDAAAGPPPAPAPAAVPIEPVDREPPAAASERGPGIAATVFASGRGVATGAGPVLGAGAAVSATAWRGRGRPLVWLSGSYNAPFGEQTADVTVQTTVTSLRAGGSFAVVAAPAFGVDAGVGAGADVFHTVPSPPGVPAPTLTLGPTMDIVDPVVSARVSAGVRVAAGARLVVAVDLDYDLSQHRYVTAQASTHASVFEPWAARPSLLLGLCVPLVGGLGCVE